MNTIQKNLFATLQNSAKRHRKVLSLLIKSPYKTKEINH